MRSEPNPPARWPRYVLLLICGVILAGALYHRFTPRAAELPLISEVDGPPPASAAGVVVYLHGLGQSIPRTRGIVARLREAGLPADYAIVLFEGPFATWFGQSWGTSAEEQASSRRRVRARLHELLGDRGPPRSRVVIAGFSQGAGMALDVAVEDARIGGLGSFSPCHSWLRGELPNRDALRVLLAHGTRDERCPVEESRSLARVLERAHEPPRYIEFDGAHEVPPDAIRALVELALQP